MISNTGEMADQCNKTRWNFCLWRNAGPLAVLLGYRSWKHLVSGNCKVFCHTSELCCCFVFPPRLWKWCQVAGREFIQGPSDVRRSTRTDEKIATLKLSGSHTVEPNQSPALRYGWHLGTNLRKTHFMLSVWFTARMCHYDWNVSVCFHMFLAAGHHMFAEQNTACSACLSGKFNKSHPRSLFGMDGKYPIFQPGGSEVTLSTLEQHQMLTKRRRVKVGRKHRQRPKRRRRIRNRAVSGTQRHVEVYQTSTESQKQKEQQLPKKKKIK